MSDASITPPQWYPDPLGRHEMRYWDGTAWTEHVSSHGAQKVDPPSGEPNMVYGSDSAAKIRQQVEERAGIVPSTTAGGGIFDQPVLVVNQKVKLIELNNEYAIFDPNGEQIGLIRQVGQSKAKKAIRLLSSLDQFMTHTLQVVDMNGAVLLVVTRPAKVVKSRVIIQDGAGADVGEIVQENVFGKIRFGMFANGDKIGSINAENWRAWNFSITDDTGIEVARITKTWEGLARTMFTTADNYVVKIERQLDDPLRSMVVAAALTIDTALKQDNRGLG
ncbi:MAG: phospholipid scramblase-related protein [Acidimicrobiia bacterium]|nr:phospholipid scramblase-related protein [Acidimicrobiia bacterium]